MFRDDQPSYVPSDPGLPPPQIDNPTDSERYALAKYALTLAGRPGDFDNIIRLLSPPPDITTIANPGEFKNIKVGIIGGGVAGLSSAFELRKLGFDITVFEALEDRIGGRIFTYYFDKKKDLYGELGAMRIPVTHESSWHYINLFNLNTRPYIQDNENGFLYLNNVRVRNDAEGKNVMEKIYPKYNLRKWERNTPWTELIDYALETPLLNMSPEVRTQLLKVHPKYSYLINYWDYHNIRQVMEMSGLSQSAITLLANLSPFTGSFFYYSFIEVLQESNPLLFTFLYEVIGGMVNIPLAIYNSLINPAPKEYENIPYHNLGDVKVLTGTWIDGIYDSKEDNTVILKYKNRHMAKHLYEKFDYIICANPFSTLRNIEIYPLFRNSKMQAIKEVGYSAAQKTLFLCNRRFWEEGSPNERIIGGGSFTDMPISSIWYPSDHGYCVTNNNKYSRRLKDDCSPLNPGVITASYNFTSDAIRVGNLYDNMAFEKIKRQVEQVHGLPRNYLDRIVEDFVTLNWNQEPWSLGGFSYFRPEQKRLFSYVMSLPEYNNKVFFAGEHLSSAHGWMNGAFQTGMKAANDIARVAKIHRGI